MDCPACGRTLTRTGAGGLELEVYREEAAAEEYRRLFGEEMEKLRRASRERGERSRSLARALRFVLPSYWIPGDQEWRAF